MHPNSQDPAGRAGPSVCLFVDASHLPWVSSQSLGLDVCRYLGSAIERWAALRSHGFSALLLGYRF